MSSPLSPPDSAPAAPRPLSAIRVDLDRIDDALHQLLIERGDVIEEVLRAKQAAGDSGSAFRPGREADQMRRLALRHRGRYPLDAAENIWRVMIATSTFMQVPFAVHADVSAGDAPVRESVRFHFGFTVPFRPARNAASVIDAVASSHGDLGVFALDQGYAAGAWWHRLEGMAAPKIIARLPFIPRPDHPAGLAVFVVAKPQSEGLAREVTVASLVLDRWNRSAAAALEALGVSTTAAAGTAVGAALLVAHAPDLALERLTEALESAKCALLRYSEVGCHAAQFSGAA